jgi:hypothetical protein
MKEFLSIYRLPPGEVERFDATYRGDLGMSEMLEDSAEQWRYYMRAEGKTIEACRWDFLSSMIAENVPEALPEMKKLPTIARYLCMRVEQLVLTEDFSA